MYVCRSNRETDADVKASSVPVVLIYEAVMVARPSTSQSGMLGSGQKSQGQSRS